jgi:hypothetical protein
MPNPPPLRNVLHAEARKLSTPLRRRRINNEIR